MNIREEHGVLNVNRWHQNASYALRNSGDNNAAHTGRMAYLCSRLHPNPTVALYEAILHHDAAEKMLGDLGYNVKVGAYGAAYKAEQDRLNAVHGWASPATDMDARWLKYLDRLDAYLWAKSVDPSVLDTNEWRLELNWLAAESQFLSVSYDEWSNAA